MRAVGAGDNECTGVVPGCSRHPTSCPGEDLRDQRATGNGNARFLSVLVEVKLAAGVFANEVQMRRCGPADIVRVGQAPATWRLVGDGACARSHVEHLDLRFGDERTDALRHQRDDARKRSEHGDENP